MACCVDDLLTHFYVTTTKNNKAEIVIKISKTSQFAWTYRTLKQ